MSEQRGNTNSQEDSFGAVIPQQYQGEQNSQGGREYRKGKQERKVTPGNRIREIEMPHKPLDV